MFEHLTGHHVMGVYAMLDDETRWFLAVDLDKSTWTEDARALVETARCLGLPAVVLVSRYLDVKQLRPQAPKIEPAQGRADEDASPFAAPVQQAS